MVLQSAQAADGGNKVANCPPVQPAGRAAAGVGYDVFCANHRIGAMPSEDAQKSLRLFGEEVIPAFR